MPELSRFYGIVIAMYRELGGRHHYPHVHVDSSGAKAVFNIETATLMEGTIPNKDRKLVEAWIEIHKKDLLKNWEQLNTEVGTPNVKKIPPLQ